MCQIYHLFAKKSESGPKCQIMFPNLKIFNCVKYKNLTRAKKKIKPKIVKLHNKKLKFEKKMLTFSKCKKIEKKIENKIKKTNRVKNSMSKKNRSQNIAERSKLLIKPSHMCLKAF